MTFMIESGGRSNSGKMKNPERSLSATLANLTRLAFAGLIPVLLFTACAGYRLGSVKPKHLHEVTTIAIPTFKNETLHPQTSVMVTNAVIKRFQQDGTYRIAHSRNADAILKGTLRTVEREQLRSSPTDQLDTTELGVTLQVRYELIDRSSGAILDRGDVSGDTAIFLDPNFQLSERQAVPVAAARMADQLVSRLSEGW